MAKIRLLTPDLGVVAGSAAYCEELALRLVARGHQVTVVCLRASDRVRGTCHVVETGRSPRRDGRLVWRFAYYFDEAHCRQALNAAKLGDVDVVIALEHMYLRPHRALFPQTPWLYVPLSFIAPLEIRSYNLSPISKWASARLFARLQRWAMRESSATVRFTRMSCDALDDYYRRRPAGRYVVNAMPVSIPARAAMPSGDGVLRMTTIGRLVESKNVDLAVTKLSALKHYQWRFDIIGDGNRLEPTRRLVKSLGLQDKVFCHGRQPETESWLRKADLFLFTSRLDNCPVAVLEAMSYGVPVLAIRPNGTTYVSGIEELVEHGQTGLLAVDEQDFQRQLEEALVAPERLIPLGAAARQQTLANHTWDAHIDRYEQLFERLKNVTGVASHSRRLEPFPMESLATDAQGAAG